MFMLMSTVNAQNVELYADFEANGTDITLSDWQGILVSESIDNPFPGGINSSLKVAKLTMHPDDPERLTSGSSYTGYFDLESSPIFYVDVYTTEIVDINIKLEGMDWGRDNVTKTTTINTINEWTTVEIDFSGTTNVLLNKFGISFSGDNNNAGDVYYIDNIYGSPFYTFNQIDLQPNDGSTNVSATSNLYIYANQGLVKSDNSELTDADLANVVVLRESDNLGQDLSFSATINGDKNVITIDPTENFDSNRQYYFSINEYEIAYNDASSVNPESSTFISETIQSSQMLIDFESTETDASFSSWGGAGFEKIENPDKSGINMTNYVGQYTVPSGDAGIENGNVNGSTLSFFNYEATPFFRVKVWVDKPVTVHMQLQNDPDWGNNSGVKEILVSETNKWVQLTYNFSSQTANNHNRVQLYFDRSKSGGSIEGDIYYFDEIHKGNTPPPAEIALNPADGSTDIVTFSNLSVVSNIEFKNTDGSEITDASPKIELREGSSTGTIVPSKAVLSDDELTMHIVPNNMLQSNTTYWYGIIDGTTQFANQTPVNGVYGTFTTSATSPTFTMYEDNEGVEDNVLIQDTMGDPAGNSAVVTDPDDSSNMVLQWDKNSSWSGWNRVHYELDNSVDFNQGHVFSIKIKSLETAWVRFKVGDQKDDGGDNKEMDANILLANQWQTLYFDGSDIASDKTTYTHVSIYVNGGDSTAATYYIDDFKGPLLANSASIGDAENHKLSIYPNPVSEHIYFSNARNGDQVNIYDLTGRTIISEKITNDQIDVSDMDKGVYILTINNSAQQIVIE